MNPELGYFICNTTRSGGGVLGETLWRTGLAGRPDQYFKDRNIDKFSESWGVDDPLEYVDAVLERATTPNGVFGLRLTRRSAAELAQRLKRCGAINDAMDWRDATDLLADRLPAINYVWLRRRDKVRQSISSWRRDTGGPTARRVGEKRRSEPAVFSFVRIDKMKRRFIEWDRDWAEYFESRRISPMTLYYEDDIETDIPATVRRVLDYIGIDIPPDLEITVSREKLADAESDRLVRLFGEAEAARSGTG